MTDAELTFDGDLDWLGGAGSPWHALAEGADPGTVEPLVTALPRLLLDGEIVTHERDANREMTVLLVCEGDDALALAEAEADLVTRLSKAESTLRWKPPGLNTPVSVFRTFRGRLRQSFDDLDELNARRVYEVTLPALPHARSESESTAVLTLGRRLVDDGTDAGNWTPVGPDEVSSVGGRIRLRVTEQLSGGGLFTATGLMIYGERIALDRGRYISVVVDDPTGFLSYEVQAAAIGFPIDTAAATEAAGAGRTRYYFGPFEAGFVEDFKVQVSADKGTSITLPVDFWVDDVYVEASLPSGSSRFVYGEVEVDGSVRSPQNLTVTNAALGNVQVFVAQPHAGFRPDLSDYLTGSTGSSYTADATKVSGGYLTGGEHTFDVPAVTLRPVSYQVIGHVNLPTAGTGYTHALASQLFAADGTTELTEVVSQSKRTTPRVDGWQFVTLGTVYPAAEVSPDSTNLFRLIVDLEAGVSFDVLWLVPHDAPLLQVAAGEATRLRVVAPSPEYENGAVFVGDSDADERQVLGFGAARLNFDAGVNLIHVVTTGGVLDPDDVSVTGHAAWHSNAAK